MAVVYEDQQLTYGELNARANQLAHHLRNIGVGPEALVGICVERSLDMVVGLLGILKAGGACVPLDPAYPEERLAFMLKDSAPVALLTQGKFEALFAGMKKIMPVINLQEAPSRWGNQADGSSDSDAVGLNPENLAYVIYTSGSAGNPKGACLLHRALHNLISWHINESQLSSNDAVLIVTSYAYIFTQRAIFSALLAGSRLVLASEPFDPQAIMALMAKERMSMIYVTQSGLNALVNANANANGYLSKLRRITMAGEPVVPSQLMALSEPRPEIVNNYGATECAGTAIYYRVPSDLERYCDLSLPIGRPIWNTRIYILDSHQQLVPVGVTGEIHISGAPVGRGYLNRPELTEERFVRDPFTAEADARMYKTGDLGRWLADGTIECLGRNDFQVKIRGSRIELGEIESALRQHPQLRETVVAVYEPVPGDKRLVAYLVSRGASAPTPSELRDFLKLKLPEFMVPSAFVFLDALPLTPNGKLDRKALPAPNQIRSVFDQAYVPPRSPIEEMLEAIWREILNIEQIGIHDNFFELGGHSLLAVQLIVRINKQLQIEFPLHLLFEEPTVAGLSELLTKTFEQTPAVDIGKIHTIPRDLPIPASYSQQRLLFLDRMLGASGLYNMHWAIQLNGKLDISVLQQSLNAIVARHEVLRTYFVEQDGEPFQVIKASLPFACTLMDLSAALRQENRDSEIQSILHTESNKPFDLKEAPLIRVLLLRLSEQEHILLVTIHHSIADGWSMGIFRQELASLYCAISQGQPANLPELPIQYADYAIWQRERLQGEMLERQLSYWKNQLADLPVLELPTDRPRPKQLSYRGARETIQLSATLTRDLKTLSQQQNVTLFMTLLAAFQVLLHRYSGQEDIIVGTAIAGRNQQEIENLIGFFVNTLALRTDLSGAPSFVQLLIRIREVCLSAYTHQDIPFEKLVAELQVQRDMSRHPLFQVMLILQPTTLQDMQLPGLTISKLTVTNETAKFDLALSLVEHPDGLTGTIEYSTDLFNAKTITRLAGHFLTLLEAIVEHPETAITVLPMLTVPERHQLLVEWNATKTDYPKDKCIHQLFEEQVARTPDAIALVFEDQQLSYQALNAKANQLAHYLRTLGVGPNTLVGICVERGPNMIIGLLGILKAGGAYVPLDPAYPKGRLAFMLEDSAPVALLIEAETEAILAEAGDNASKVDLNADKALWEDESNANLSLHATGLGPEHLAYVIYTSGSTAQPKGVLISHRNLVSSTVARISIYRKFGRFLLLSPVSFDSSVAGIFGTLTNAGTLIIATHDAVRDPSRLNEDIQRLQVETLLCVPSLYWLILENSAIRKHERSLKTVIVAGESCTQDLVRKSLQNEPQALLFNEYGPTEATVWSSVWCIDPAFVETNSSVPIGRPIANAQIYILDTYSEPVPIGVTGELYIGGAGVACGYLGRPELTAERFLINPFVVEPTAQMYKTGDLGRWLADGTIEFLGRNDFQVKIRGFRIELGEIEARLVAHPKVREAAVLAREDHLGDKRLVAYYTGDEDIAVEDLRAHLALTLPDYMVPAAYVRLQVLSLTPNGKLDRKALPVPEVEAYATQAYETPQGETEQALARIWTELLKIERVGRHDNFFELGGHSLLAVKVVIDVNKLFNIDLPLVAMFQSPTIVELGIIISSGNRQPSWYSLVPIQAQGSRPPLFLIHTITLHDLSRHLGMDQPIYFLRYGMAAVIGNCPIRLPPLEELAGHYIKEMQQQQPHGPYYLMGYSFGGVIAYEMACQLVSSGHQVNFVGLLDTYLTHEKQLQSLHKIIYYLFSQTPSQFFKRVKNKITDWVIPNKSGSGFWPHIYSEASDIACRKGYQPKGYNGGRVTLFQGSELERMPFSYAPPEQAWKKLLGDKLEVQQITGSHLDIFDEPHVKVLAAKIIACMDKATLCESYGFVQSNRTINQN